MKSDDQLKKDVEAELNWDPSINDSGIIVSTKDGVVTLGDHVPFYADKGNVRLRIRVVSAAIERVAIAVQPPHNSPLAYWKRHDSRSFLHRTSVPDQVPNSGILEAFRGSSSPHNSVTKRVPAPR